MWELKRGEKIGNLVNCWLDCSVNCEITVQEQHKWVKSQFSSRTKKHFFCNSQALASTCSSSTRNGQDEGQSDSIRTLITIYPRVFPCTMTTHYSVVHVWGALFQYSCHMTVQQSPASALHSAVLKKHAFKNIFL